MIPLVAAIIAGILVWAVWADGFGIFGLSNATLSSPGIEIAVVSEFDKPRARFNEHGA